MHIRWCERGLLVAALALLGAPALADEATGKVVVPVVIYGKAPRPVVAVDVAAARPKLTLVELKIPTTDRSEEAARRDPF